MKAASYFCLTTSLVLSFALSCPISAQTPFDDAVAVWQMSSPEDSSGNGNNLSVHGQPEFGFALSENEKKESLLRGGDGKAVKFKAGDYLSAGQGKDKQLDVSGKTLSIYIRLQVPSGKWDFPILAKHGGHNRLAYNIFSSDKLLGCELGTTMNRNMISATVPFTDLLPKGEGAKGWHDVICRSDGAKLEMFVDGRCVDEEFILGTIRQNTEPLLIGAESYGDNIKAGFDGLIDHIALWNRPLSNDEIIALSGGTKNADIRERTDRGIAGESLQYWRPPNNYYVGDCFPFYQDGVFHFAYLLDKGHHGAKSGFGAHQWTQATSTDLKNWKHQPFIVSITDQWEGSICTGSIFYHNGVYYAFYATRAVPDFPAPDGKKYAGEFVAYAVSTDGIHFKKQEPNPLIVLPAEEGYSRAGRDPVVFQDERDGLFHMYITSNYKGNGCWAHLTSKDLKSWKRELPVLSGGGDPECPDWFKWGDTYYLIVNWGNGFYRTSKTPTGPWEKPEASDILMPGAPRVPKTAAYHHGRRIICGWTNENGFGGHAVFHELIRYEDGTLGEKFVPEMMPATEKPVIELKNIDVPEKHIADLPEEYRLQMTITFDPKKLETLKEWRMVYYQDASRKEMIRLNPVEKTAALGSTQIRQVDLSAGKAVLDMFVKNGVVDLSINDCRTITGVIPQFPVRELRIQSPSKDYIIQSLIVSPLKRTE